MAKRREIALMLLKIPLQMAPKCCMRAGFSLFPSLCSPRPGEFSQPSHVPFSHVSSPHLSKIGPNGQHDYLSPRSKSQEPMVTTTHFPRFLFFQSPKFRQSGAKQVGEQGPLGTEVRRPPSMGLRIRGGGGRTPSTLLSEHP